MKKGTVRHNWIHCQKWIVTLTVLILILPLIPLSAGSGNGADSDMSPSAGLGNDTGSDISLSAGSGGDIESDVPPSAGSGKDIDSPENAVTGSDSQIATDKDEQSGKSAEDNLESKEGLEDGTDNQKTDTETLEEGPKASSSTGDEESSVEIPKTASDSDDGIYNHESTEEALKTETGVEKGTESPEILEENTEIKTEIKQDIDNQENPEKNQEIKQAESCSTDNLESACKAPAQKEEIGGNPEIQGNSEENLKLKTCEDSEKGSSENSGTKIEMKTGSCYGSKNMEIVEVETEPEEVCSGITNFKSEVLEPETTIEACSDENFAGTYEKGTDLTGISQTEVSILDVEKSSRSNTKHKSNTALSIERESQSPSTPKTQQSVLDTAGSLGLGGLEPQIREEALQAAEVVRKPAKLASFLIGLLGTLFIGITLRGRRH